MNSFRLSPRAGACAPIKFVQRMVVSYHIQYQEDHCIVVAAGGAHGGSDVAEALVHDSGHGSKDLQGRR